jgi:uncharacterized repeat protein (TIGR03803 family)
MKRLAICLVAVVSMLNGCSLAHAYEFRILHSFGPAEGHFPDGNVTVDGSALYGVTSTSLFRMGVDGSAFTQLPFAVGHPVGGLVSTGPVLYGMTSEGTVFSVAANLGDLTVLDMGGWLSYGGLAIGGSTLYGMSYNGGLSGAGTVFSVSTDDLEFSRLHSFAGGSSDGAYPYGELLVSGSVLYGMTRQGGSGNGTVFKLNTDGTGFSLLHSFAGGTQDGAHPYGGLALSGSTLYGMTHEGGAHGLGTVFRVGTDGEPFELLHSFAGGSSDGAGPYGGLTVSGATLYGMTTDGGASSMGTLFSIDASGSGFQLLHSFGHGADNGQWPFGSLTLSGSTLYGMTSEGGAYYGLGTVFALTIPEPPAFALLVVAAVGLAARACQQWPRALRGGHYAATQ